MRSSDHTGTGTTRSLSGQQTDNTERVVFLLDLDNTLLDNSRIVADRVDQPRWEFGLESREIKLGLYFPLLKGWREWTTKET